LLKAGSKRRGGQLKDKKEDNNHAMMENEIAEKL